jgi:predicted dehydrogenase
MAPAIHAASGADFTALATSSPEKAEPFRAFQPNLRVHESYQDLLDDPGIDAVYIPLPNHLHVEWSLKALAAGKHVLCEKPMTMNAAEFDQLIEARDASGKLAAEAYMIVHHPQWQWVKEQVESGAIGKLVHVSGGFSYDNRTQVDNIRNRPETGGGVLPDIGVYVIGCARYITGEEVQAVTSRIRWENDVDVFADIAADFSTFTYSAYVSMRLHMWQEMVFHGEAGVIRLHAPFNANLFTMASVELHRSDMEVVTKRWPAVNQYTLQVEAFSRSVATGAEYPCPLEFSKGTQQALDQIYAGAKTLS